jgi:hypothetical protein
MSSDFVKDKGVVDLSVTRFDGGLKTLDIGRAHLLGQDLEEVRGNKVGSRLSMRLNINYCTSLKCRRSRQAGSPSSSHRHQRLTTMTSPERGSLNSLRSVRSRY